MRTGVKRHKIQHYVGNISCQTKIRDLATMKNFDIILKKLIGRLAQNLYLMSYSQNVISDRITE